MAKIMLPETWAGVAEPLRALMAEVERAAHADGSEIPDFAAVSTHCCPSSRTISARLSVDMTAHVRRRLYTEDSGDGSTGSGTSGRPRSRASTAAMQSFT